MTRAQAFVVNVFIGLSVVMMCATFIVSSASNNTLAEMNERQKSVVVKQHQAITVGLTEEIRKAVDELKANH